MKTDLFERYVHQVGRRLPRKQRADVEAELHSLLMDSFQDRTEGAELEKKASQALQVSILQEMGPPEQVADKYRPRKRYIVGPRLFDIYAIVVATVSGALGLAFLITMVLSLWGATIAFADLLSTLGRFLAEYVQAIMGAIGAITIVFFVLERVLPESAEIDLREGEGEWDPRSLPAIENRAEVGRAGLVFEIGLMLAALLLFNVFADWAVLPFVASINGSPVEVHHLDVLSPAFFSVYLPLLNVAWLLHIGLNIVLLWRGRWNRVTRLASFLLALFDLYILYRMVTGSSPVTFVPNLVQIALLVVLVITAITSLHKLWLVIRGERPSAAKPAELVPAE
jgi:hypothetical protein